MAKNTSEGKAAASFRPDEMSQGGLQDDFDGTIDQALIGPWDYNGKREEYSLTVFLHITPDEGQEVDEPFWQPYTCGNINDFLPSKDGDDPVDYDNWEATPVVMQEFDPETLDDVLGYFAVPVGKRTQLSSSSNWAKFIGSMIDAGFDVDNISHDVRFVEGIHGHFARLLPERKGGGIVKDAESKSDGKILMLTDITEAPKAGKAAAKASTKKAAPAKAKASKATEEEAVEDNGETDLDSEIEIALIEAIGENDGTLPKGKVIGAMVKAFKGNPAKSKAAMTRANDVEFLKGLDSIEYDEGKSTLSLA